MIKAPKNDKITTSKIVKNLDMHLGIKGRLDSVTEMIKDNIDILIASNECMISKNNEVGRLFSNKSLEMMGNYLLYAPDTPKSNKIQFNYYTLDQLKSKFGYQSSVEELIEMSYLDSESSMINILVQYKNYKKAIKQVITKHDLTIPILKQYNELKELILTKLIILRTTKKDIKKQRKYVKLLKDIKADMIYCKEILKGTIYFKNISTDSTVIDWDMFDFSNYRHVKELLPCQNYNILTDLGMLNVDLDILIRDSNFSDLDRHIIYMYRIQGYNQEIIRSLIGKKQQWMSKALIKISQKISKTYLIKIHNAKVKLLIKQP